MTLTRRLNETSLVFFGSVLFLLFWGFAAHAQTGGVPAPAPDPNALLAQVFDAVAHGQWWMVASLAVSLLTWAFRAQVFNRLPAPVGPWLSNHPIVGLGTPFVLAAIGGIVTAAASHTPVTAALMLSEILKVGAGAVAAFIAAKKIAEASVMGAQARGEVSTPTAAVDLLKAGPQPVMPIEEAATRLIGKPPGEV